MCFMQGLGMQVILMITLASQMLLPSTYSQTSSMNTTYMKFPPGARMKPQLSEPEFSRCPKNGMVTFFDGPPLLTPSCVPAPGPVRCRIQVFVIGRGIGICRNKGYLSGWSKVQRDGRATIRCCSQDV
ncbi:uncharacterized protein LOC144621785 isoform X2 [Crassostrea virginica]